MNHIRLLIRNQCGSHIIQGMPNSLAFQQNYSRYDGPSESGIVSSLDEPVLTSYLLFNELLKIAATQFGPELSSCILGVYDTNIDYSRIINTVMLLVKTYLMNCTYDTNVLSRVVFSKRFMYNVMLLGMLYENDVFVLHFCRNLKRAVCTLPVFTLCIYTYVYIYIYISNKPF